MSAPGPTSYNTESYWAEQQNQQWSDQMDTLDTFSNPAAQLKYIVQDMALFVSDTNMDYIFWDAQYMDTVSEVLMPDLDTIKTSFNDLQNEAYVGDVSEVDTAMNAANQILYYLYTDPLFSDNTQLQDQFVASMTDLFMTDPTQTAVTYSYTVDGQAASKSVPQFDPDGVNFLGVPNDQYTADNWDMTEWPSGAEPNDTDYRYTMQDVSNWNSDLMVMSDSLDDMANQAQEEMQEGESTSQQIDGTWHDMMKNFSKGIADQVNNQITN